MKTPPINYAWALAGAVAISLACSPIASAQSSNPTADTTQNSKTSDSTADQNSSTTGAPGAGTGTLDKTSSRDTTNSLDMNPSMAPTGSANQSGTKNPNPVAPDQTSASTSSRSDKMSDREFMLKAAQGGMTEVELGKLAQEKGSSSDVKEFGSHMVMDHSKANEELKAIAANKGVTLPSALDAKHQAAVDRLQHLSGPAFDRAYVKAMVKDHEKDAAEFRDASDSAQDPDVKNFAGNTLKMIDSHLADIKSIQSKMK